MRIAKERKSSVLASNAVHHRIDCLTSIVALIAIGGSRILPDATWLDPSGGLIVSLMVIRAGWANTGAALLELADVGIDEEIKESVRKAANKALSMSGEAGADLSNGENGAVLRAVQGIKAGQNYLAEVELAVPGSWSLNAAQKVEQQVRECIGSQIRGIRRVRVRFVAQETGIANFSDEFVRGDVSLRRSPEPEDEKSARREYHSQNDSNSDLRHRT